jgi:hypothetical protein
VAADIDGSLLDSMLIDVQSTVFLTDRLFWRCDAVVLVSRLNGDVAKVAFRGMSIEGRHTMPRSVDRHRTDLSRTFLNLSFDADFLLQSLVTALLQKFALSRVIQLSVINKYAGPHSRCV